MNISKNNLLDIVSLLLGKIIKKLNEKGIKLIVQNELKEKIVELGYNPVFGARELKRVIQDKIENELAIALLNGKLKKGDQVKIDPESFKLKIN